MGRRCSREPLCGTHGADVVALWSWLFRRFWQADAVFACLLAAGLAGLSRCLGAPPYGTFGAVTSRTPPALPSQASLRHGRRRWGWRLSVAICGPALPRRASLQAPGRTNQNAEAFWNLRLKLKRNGADARRRARERAAPVCRSCLAGKPTLISSNLFCTLHLQIVCTTFIICLQHARLPESLLAI